MNHRLIALLLLTAAPCAAQPVYVYTVVGYQQITSLATATALTIPTAPPPSGPPTIVEVCVETAAVRYRDDGTAPTATVGIPVAAGACFQYSANLAAIQFIQQAGGAVLNVAYYR